jgi:Flp pilus assembly protein TadD
MRFDVVHGNLPMNERCGRTGIQAKSTPERRIATSAARLVAGRGALAALLLFATLSYLGVLHNDFTYTYDDKALILDNPVVHNLGHLREAVSTTLFASQGPQQATPYYRPVETLGFLLCYQLFGPAAYGYHLFSLLLHAAVVVVLFQLAGQASGDRVAAFAAAGLFAVHPVHVESVAWISAVSDIEMTLFYLVAFWCFMQIARRGGGSVIPAELLMILSFVLALLAKEQAMTLPLLAVIYEHFYRSDRAETTRGQKLLRYGPLWLVILGYILLRVRLMRVLAPATRLHSINATELLLSALALVGRYCGKLVWPARLSAFYPFHASASLLTFPVLAGVGALAACAWLFRILWRHARLASFAILWLLITLVPVLNARWMSAYVFAERYLYLPSAGFCLAVGWALSGFRQTSAANRIRLPKAAIITASLVAVLCVLRIATRVPDWRDDVALYTKSLAAEPGDYRLHDALGQACWIRGNAQAAESEWRQTLRLKPDNSQTLSSLGALYAGKRRFEQATPLLWEALRINPNDAVAHLSLGAVYAETGERSAAEREFLAAVLLSPLNFTAHNLLGKLYYDAKRLAPAEQQFLLSVQCEPNVAAYDHLGYIYSQNGDQGRAEGAFRAALSVNTTDSRAHFNLGLIFAARKQSEQAATEYRMALAADPNNPEIRSALEKISGERQHP